MGGAWQSGVGVDCDGAQSPPRGRPPGYARDDVHRGSAMRQAGRTRRRSPCGSKSGCALLQERTQTFLSLGWRRAVSAMALRRERGVGLARPTALPRPGWRRLCRGNRFPVRTSAPPSRYGVDRCSRAGPGGTTACAEPNLPRALCRETGAGQRTAARGGAPDLDQHERRDRGRDESPAHLREPEHGASSAATTTSHTAARPRGPRRAPLRARVRWAGPGEQMSARNMRRCGGVLDVLLLAGHPIIRDIHLTSAPAKDRARAREDCHAQTGIPWPPIRPAR